MLVDMAVASCVRNDVASVDLRGFVCVYAS